MVFPAVGIALASAFPTALHLGSKVSKFYGKHGNTSLGQATQFGLGYGASTNIGYNLSNNFVTGGLRPKYSNSNIATYNLTNRDMPYGYYPSRRRYSSRYSRFGRRRFGRRSYRRYSSYNRYSRY